MGELFRPGELRRGVALSMQVLAQATGPLMSGVLRDWTGNYVRSLELFAILAALATIIALVARPPGVARP
jgi:cyanate permease